LILASWILGYYNVRTVLIKMERIPFEYHKFRIEPSRLSRIYCERLTPVSPTGEYRILKILILVNNFASQEHDNVHLIRSTFK